MNKMGSRSGGAGRAGRTAEGIGGIGPALASMVEDEYRRGLRTQPAGVPHEEYTSRRAATTRTLQNILGDYRNLDEARGDLETFGDRELVRFTPRGDAISPEVLGNAIRYVDKHPALQREMFRR